MIDKRLQRVHEVHVAPLNNWVVELRRRFGPTAFVPWFDPDDGGTNASILWLLEAPGKRATREHGGSGFVSSDNDDATAQNTWTTREEAGVDRKMVVHWNVIPYYIGTSTGIRPARSSDLIQAGELLSEVLELLPQLKVVVLGGRIAQRAWRGSRPPGAESVPIVESPHPSPLNVNSRPGTRDEIVAAWRSALQLTKP